MVQTLSLDYADNDDCIVSRSDNLALNFLIALSLARNRVERPITSITVPIRFHFLCAAMNSKRPILHRVVLICALAHPGTGYGSEPPKKPLQPFGNDVTLKDSTLFGNYVSATGSGIHDVRASIRQAGKEVASAVTDAQGNFKITGLQTGVYEVIIGCKSEFIRVWDHEVAPPMARPSAKIVRDGNLQGNGGTGGALKLMGAGGNGFDLFGGLFKSSPTIQSPTVIVPSVP